MVKKLLMGVFLLFFFLFLIKSIYTMIYTPMHDFDEANRSESASRMLEFNEFIVPLTGAPFWRIESLGIEAKRHPGLHVYYHLERTPFVMWFMAGMREIFGKQEWAYRFPSFAFGVATLGLLYFFIKKLRSSVSFFPLIIAYVIFMTASDWWLSSQMALQDTTLSFFLFGALGCLLIYLKEHHKKWLILSGVSWGFAFLAKGPAAVPFIVPFFLYFVVLNKNTLKKRIAEGGILMGSAIVIVLPWLTAVLIKFGIPQVVHIFFVEFPRTRFSVEDVTQKAPVYWYFRWLIETFRTGWLFFWVCFIFEMVTRKMTKEKILLVAYILGTLVIFSLAKNKVWWYILSMVPAISLYVYLVMVDYLEKYKARLWNVGVILILTALPLFYQTTNTKSLLYFCILMFAALGIFYNKMKLSEMFQNVIFVIGITGVLFSFYLRFPVIMPPHPETKKVAEYINNLPGSKCVFVKDMPYESLLFYLHLEQVDYFYSISNVHSFCTNYLVSPNGHYPGTPLKTIHGLSVWKLIKK